MHIFIKLWCIEGFSMLLNIKERREWVTVGVVTGKDLKLFCVVIPLARVIYGNCMTVQRKKEAKTFFFSSHVF